MVHVRTTARNRPDVLVWRAARLRCPNCGRGRLFRRWLEMRRQCPECGLATDRGETDYFLGAMMFNLVAAEGVFVVVMLAAVLATWPRPPWAGLLVAGSVLMIGAPFLFYPVTKTLWLAFDLIFRPLSDEGDPAESRQIELPPPTA